MKRKLISIFAVAFLIFAPIVSIGNQSAGRASASAQKTCYARVEVAGGNFGADFFGENNKTESLFQIPNHYYVLANGVDGEFFKVTYKDALSGFVKKSDVVLVEGTPQNKYPTNSFNAKTEGNLFNFANKNSKGVAVTDDTALEYFGQKSGQSLQTDINGNPVTTWFYVRTASNEFGYIHTTDVTQVPNTARAQDDADLLLPHAAADFFAEPQQAAFSGLSLGTQIMLIVAIGLPSLMILYFLIKPTKLAQASKSKQKNPKKSKKRVSHGDYFEFDESEL